MGRNFGTGIIGGAAQAFNEGRFSEAEKMLKEHESLTKTRFGIGDLQARQGALQLQRDRFGQEKEVFESTTLPESEGRQELTRIETEELIRLRDENAVFRTAEEERLQREGTDRADFKAEQTVTAGQEAIAKSKAGAATAGVTESLAPDVEEAQRKKLETSVVLDDLQEKTAQALIGAGQPKINAETQVAILKLQPELTRSLIDLNVAKAGGQSISQLKKLALASGWTEDQFNRWALTSEQIKRAQPLLTSRQQIFKVLADIQTDTGDRLSQIIAQATLPGSSLEGLIPANADKARATAILKEQLTSVDNLIATLIPDWPSIVNRSASLAGPETGVGGLRREEGRTARPEPASSTPQQRRLSQDEIRQRALEFNASRGQ